MKVFNLGNDYALQRQLKEKENDRTASTTTKAPEKSEEKKVQADSAPAPEKKEEKKTEKTEAKSDKT